MSTATASVEGRARAIALAATDPQRALKIARRIPLPWYRCQALVYVAEPLATGERKHTILREAFAAADAMEDPNRIATVAAWPLRVLAKNDQRSWLEAELSRLLAIIRTEPHPVSRADGLGQLLWALQDGPPDLRQSVFEETLQANLSAHGWKRDRKLAHLAARVFVADPARGVAIAEAIEKNQYRKMALRMIADVASRDSEATSPSDPP